MDIALGERVRSTFPVRIASEIFRKSSCTIKTSETYQAAMRCSSSLSKRV